MLTHAGHTALTYLSTLAQLDYLTSTVGPSASRVTLSYQSCNESFASGLENNGCCQSIYANNRVMRLSILDSAYFTVTMAINLLKLVKRVHLLYVKAIWRTVLYDRHTSFCESA